MLDFARIVLLTEHQLRKFRETGNRTRRPTWPNRLSATIDTVRPSKRGRTACGFRPVHLEFFRSRDEVGQAFCESRSTLEAGSYRFLLFKIGAARRGFLRHHKT